jgi:ubiquinone/menaquinone biosynthesis C-methylase UbiE
MHELWNGHAGRAWVEAQALLDQLFQPFEDLLVEATVGNGGGASEVLDVGCGTGSTTLAVARRLGAGGSCTGIDVSVPMITAARARAEREGLQTARFLVGDAQTHHFAPGSFDQIISRFGVMFFDDPVEAFRNLRRAAKVDGRLSVIAFRSPTENPFMTTAERAAAPVLPNLPERRLDGPGQFAFADDRKVHRILEESGWREIDIQAIDVPCTMLEAELVRYFTWLGPLGLALEGVDEKSRAHVVETVRAAFDPYVQGEQVRFTAACWMIGARASEAS